MAVTYNLKGTTNPSFKVGKTGNGTVYAENLEATSGQQLLLSGTSLTWTGDIVTNSIVSTNFYINDTADIFLDAAGGDVILKKGGGTQHGYLSNDNDNFVIKASVADKDLIFRGSDSGSEITALTLDMSDAGAATFGGNVTVSGNLTVSGTTTTVNSTTIAVTNSFTFEGATADDFETVLTVTDPTADRTVTIPDASGTISLIGSTETLTNKTLTTPIITEIQSGSGITLDASGTIVLDSENAKVLSIKQNTTEAFSINTDGSSATNLTNPISDADISFLGNDGGATITALTLDMSDGGTAIFNKDIKLGDSKNIELGASGDLRLYHDGSHSYIDEVGTGSLIARGSVINIQSDDLNFKKYDGTESYLIATGDGAVEIRHDNTAVLTTVAGGITVGGSNTITDTKVGQWDTAYGYGNHASAGYISGTLGFPTDLGAVTGSTTSYLGLGPDLGSIATGDTFVGLVKDFGGFSETVRLSGVQTLTNKTITDAASISIANTSTDDSLLLTTTEDSNTAGPVLSLKRNSSSPADADYLGQIKFKGENDNDQEVNYAKITGKIDDASDGSEDGLIEFAVASAGSQEIVARIKNDGLFLNTGNNIKFEGATADAHELTLTVADPTSDRTITLPDETGILIVKDAVTGMIQLPVGTTAERPTPSAGMMRFNTTINRFEGYNGTDWVPMSPYPNDITTSRDGDEVQVQPTDLGSVT